jgi:hypothetical protein
VGKSQTSNPIVCLQSTNQSKCAFV